MTKPTTMTISGVPIEITPKKPMLNNKKTKIDVVTITAKETADHVRKGQDGAVALDYDDVKAWVNANKKSLFGPDNSKIKINVFTAQGWRISRESFSNENLNWFNLNVDSYEEDIEIDKVYAIQILYLS